MNNGKKQHVLNKLCGLNIVTIFYFLVNFSTEGWSGIILSFSIFKIKLSDLMDSFIFACSDSAIVFTIGVFVLIYYYKINRPTLQVMPFTHSSILKTIVNIFTVMSILFTLFSYVCFTIFKHNFDNIILLPKGEEPEYFIQNSVVTTFALFLKMQLYIIITTIAVKNVDNIIDKGKRHFIIMVIAFCLIIATVNIAIVIICNLKFSYIMIAVVAVAGVISLVAAIKIRDGVNPTKKQVRT